MKILALCDSPTLTTGFGRVAQNLFSRWHECGATVDCWGIGFRGWSYKSFPYVNEFYPGGMGADWYQPENLTLFIAKILKGDYTHVWIMQDTFLLSPNGFPKALRDACKKKNVISLLYFPVDAALDAEWCRIISAVDIPVAYTEYGRRAAIRAMNNPPKIHVLPHGVDTAVHHPVDASERLRLRANIQRVDAKKNKTPWLAPDDFLMINVNNNQRRKDVSRSLEILKELRARGVPAKLLMHMPESNNGLSLESVGAQLGLTLGVDWLHNGPLFRGSLGTLTEAQLANLYNMADLYLTTTLGEGWGLGITEALACGLPVAIPNHTACAEIYGQLNFLGMGDRVIAMPVEDHGVYLESDNSRQRLRTQVSAAAENIQSYFNLGQWREHPGLNESVKQWLSWDRIAEEFLSLMGAEIKESAAQ